MPDPLLQLCTWPGVGGVESLTCTVSHGISPSSFILTTYPQTAAPAAFGVLTIGDGERTIAFRDCRVESITGRIDSGGQKYTLVIQDRRWRWKTGAVSGRYNQLDPRGKLVPWTIRSPEELARLCLEAMGEKGFTIDLPKGLVKADGDAFVEYLKAGENFAQTLANPPVAWDKTPPAEALARLCDYYGRRVVWQPVADRVVIAPLGVGRPLPADLPCESITPAVEQAAIPAAIGVAGAPVRIQCRLQLEPVGEEWDSSYRPVNELSYAPMDTAGKKEVVRVTCSGAGAGLFMQVRITCDTNWKGDTVKDRVPLHNNFAAGPAGTGADKVVALAAEINDAWIGTLISATTDNLNQVLVLTGKEVGFPFQVEALVSGVANRAWTAEMQTGPVPPGTGWFASHIPGLFNVKPTNRLTYDDAVKKARNSVFKCYRVKSPTDPNSQPKLPWFGKVFPRKQLVLQKSRVEQVVPEPRKADRFDRGSLVPPGLQVAAGGAPPDFYNGYSRDRAARVFGSVSTGLAQVIWDGEAGHSNTRATAEVDVPFTIDEKEQVVKFSEPVYENFPILGTANAIRFPTLVLETSVFVLDEKTGALVRWEELFPLGGAGPVQWLVREDVSVGIVGRYDDKHELQLFLFGTGDLGDARSRARYYAEGAARAYELKGGETRQYIGIVPIEPDGLVQQVTWSIGAGGATTVASSNTEHSTAIPSYPARRRSENLPPDKAATEANEREGRWLDKLPAKGP